MNQILVLSLAWLAAARLFAAEKAPPSAVPSATDGPEHIIDTAVALGKRMAPPPMPHRSITPSTNALPGESMALEDQGIKFTLFIPRTWTATAQPTLTVHFHAAVWFVIQEHLWRGAKGPLACFQLGEGSTVYRQAFEDTNRLGRVLRLVEGELKKRGAPAPMKITAVDLSSFSAGYGAVRELVKSPQYFPIVQRIVLLDSMYAAYDETHSQTEPRKPAREQIDVWVPFARAAMRGEKTFVFTHSAVPTDKYASSSECAMALVMAVGARAERVEPNSIAAANDPDFPVRQRTDIGNFHVWGYGGEDAAAHLTHVRHMAAVWRAIDN